MMLSSSGNTWSFSNLTQFTLAKTQSQSGATLSDGICAQSAVGTVVSIPAASATGNAITVAVGPSGFLVLNNGQNSSGAVGLIQPSTALNTSSLLSANYLGFISEPAIPIPLSGVPTANQIAFFGCPSSGCPASGNSLVGGAFPNDDPTQPANTNITINLGTQNATNNGLFDSATVTIPDPVGVCTAPGVAGKVSQGNPTCTLPRRRRGRESGEQVRYFPDRAGYRKPIANGDLPVPGVADAVPVRRAKRISRLMWKHIFLPTIIILFAGGLTATAQFAEAPQYATNSPAGKGPSSVAVGDFEGDASGRDDVAVVDATGTVSIFLNKRDGSGTFSTPPATYKVTTGASGYQIASGNFNTASQSSPDLIVADNLGNVTVLLSNGNGTFQTPSVQFSTNANFSSIVTDDLNGDGIWDAVVADSKTGSAWVLTGKGNGAFASSNFQTGLSQSSQPVFLALGNVIDPKPSCPDLIAAAQDGTVAVLGNSNDQHCSGGQSIIFKVSLVMPPDPNPNGQGIPAGVTSVFAANYGGSLNTGAPSGLADIVVASTGLSQLNFNSFPSAYLLWNATLGPGQVSFILDTFFGQPTAQVGLNPVSMVGADIDGDGILDLVVANQSDNSVTVLFGDGFGVPLSSPNTGGPPVSAAGVWFWSWSGLGSPGKIHCRVHPDCIGSGDSQPVWQRGQHTAEQRH